MSMPLRPVVRAFTTCSAIVLALALLLISRPSFAVETYTLYMVGGGLGALSGLWTVNTTTGAATYVAPIQDAGGDLYLYAGGLAYDTSNHKLYALGQSFLGVSMLYTVNPATGFATAVGPSGATINFGTSGLAIDTASHKFYAVGDMDGLGQHRGLFDVNPSTGAATLIGPTVKAGAYLYDVGLDPFSGILYANGTNDFLGTPSKLCVLDKGSGAETVIGEHGITLGRQMYYGGMAIHPITHICYGIGSISASAAGLYTVNTSTGAATLVGNFVTNGTTDGALAFVPDQVTRVGPLPIGERALAASPNPFTRETTLSYSLDGPAHVEVGVFDIAGRRVATLFRGTQGSGDQRVTWNGKASGFDAPVGVYFVRVVVDGAQRGVMKLVRLND
jgi:FlgD Ig-like domain